jgi:hypothetical protein
VTLFDFLVWMSPWAAFAAIALYVGYVAWQAQEARENAALEPRGPDPIVELERINTEIGRAATAARLTIEQTRETVRRGTR